MGRVAAHAGGRCLSDLCRCWPACLRLLCLLHTNAARAACLPFPLLQSHYDDADRFQQPILSLRL